MDTGQNDKRYNELELKNYRLLMKYPFSTFFMNSLSFFNGFESSEYIRLISSVTQFNGAKLLPNLIIVFLPQNISIINTIIGFLYISNQKSRSKPRTKQ